MKRWMILLFVLILGPASHAQNTLYPIFEGDLWGYINKTGKVVIKPQFRNALAFSEGLAAVRIKGRYGYIDTSGRVVIAAIYDRDNPFTDGLAQVFRDGKPFFIDKGGNKIFEHSFARIVPFQQHSVTIAGTGTGKYCLIDRQGKMVTDTVFKEIERLGEAGIFAVSERHVAPYTTDSEDEEYVVSGIIDSTGRFIVPYGRYTDIEAFGKHYFRASPYEERNKIEVLTGTTAIIDERGKLVMESVPGQYFAKGEDAGFSNGLAVTSRYAEREDKSGKWNLNFDRRYIVVIDEQGKVRISDTTWADMTPFSWGHAFARDVRTDKWVLIDRNGAKVNDSLYIDVLYDGRSNSPEDLFGNGVAYVKARSGWVGIDTNGSIVSGSRLNDLDYRFLIRKGGKIYGGKDISVESSKYSYIYGFWNAKNNTLLRPTYHWLDKHFNNGIGMAMRDGRYYYINDNGGVVWRSKKAKDGNGTLNIDYMNRGYYYAASEYRKDLAGYGGWGKSENKARTVKQIKGDANQLTVLIDDSKKTKWNGYNAIKLFVTNYSGDTLYFNAQDSRLYLTMQAKKENGEWADIEYLPSSWCGNSYHQVFLAPGQYWQFATPLYEGEIKTKLRAKLRYKKNKKQETSDEVYSNEISGSVNPGQFWYKRKYTPGGLMDSYND